MLACYALGIIAAVATAWVFKRSLLKGGPTTFILELPTYKIPQAAFAGYAGRCGLMREVL